MRIAIDVLAQSRWERRARYRARWSFTMFVIGVALVLGGWFARWVTP